TFDPSLAGQTITLAQGQLELRGAGAGTITIDGSSLSQPITISGGSVNRTFQVDSGALAVLSGLFLTGGVVNEQFVLGGGGAIFACTPQPATIVGCTINNRGTNPPDTTTIENITDSVMTISNSTITHNTGGIANYGTLTVSACTLTGNQPGAGLSLMQGT